VWQQLHPPAGALYETVTSLAANCASRAADSDTAARFPLENYDALHEAGLLALTVPQAYGGLSGDPLLHALCLMELAKGCGSTALTFTMHSTVLTFIAALGTEEQKQYYFQEVVEDGRRFASLTSEPGSSFRDKFEMKTLFHPVAGGYRVEGLKHFCSIGRHADRYFVSGKLAGASTAQEGFLSAVIPAGPGVTVVERWEDQRPLGMRATCSDVLRFDVFVPQDQVIGGPGALLASGLFARFPLNYAAVYLGLGDAALAAVTAHLCHRTLPPQRVQAHRKQLAAMRETLEDARARLVMAASAFLHGERIQAVRAIAQAKLAGAQAGRRVTYEAMELAGGSSLFGASLPLERLYRDASCGPLMPPSNVRCAELIERIDAGEKGVALLDFL
jgi:hypothetical protein